MAFNPTVKRYAKDLGIPIPNVEFCPTEFPRLNTFTAPYLPLQLENERHDEHYVVLSGKVIAFDSMGFLVPAGYVLDQETVAADADFGAAAVNFDSAGGDVVGLLRYSQLDVDEGVLNSAGNVVVLNEPVVWSMIRNAGVLINGGVYDDTGGDGTGDTNGFSFAITVSNHIGVAGYSWLRASSNVLTRTGNEVQPDVAAPGNKEAQLPLNPMDQRFLAWEPQMRNKTVRTNYCLEFPVVLDLDDLLISGQAVAVDTGGMASFPLASRVTYDQNSNIVPHAMSLVGADLAGADAADATAINLAVERYHQRSVGQVLMNDTRFPKAYLDRVRTRWEDSIPGFVGLDRMPGTATDGFPWMMHTAQTQIGKILVSLYMR